MALGAKRNRCDRIVPVRSGRALQRMERLGSRPHPCYHWRSSSPSPEFGLVQGQVTKLDRFIKVADVVDIAPESRVQNGMVIANGKQDHAVAGELTHHTGGFSFQVWQAP